MPVNLFVCGYRELDRPKSASYGLKRIDVVDRRCRYSMQINAGGCFMAKVRRDQDFDEALSKIGPDATATFDNSESNPTEHASSEATNAATAVDSDDEELEEEDDDDAALEEDDEVDEEEDVEDEAGV
jgi:hypothetical protein